jgi:hypothetical protein
MIGTMWYYVDVPKPDDTEIILNLADFPTGAAIYIYKKNKIDIINFPYTEGQVLKKRFSRNVKKCNCWMVISNSYQQQCSGLQNN